MQWLAHTNQCRNLQTLILNICPLVTDTFVRSVSRLKDLTFFSLKGNNMVVQQTRHACSLALCSTRRPLRTRAHRPSCADSDRLWAGSVGP